mgnify:CR=1 FL=1
MFTSIVVDSGLHLVRMNPDLAFEKWVSCMTSWKTQCQNQEAPYNDKHEKCEHGEWQNETISQVARDWPEGEVAAGSLFFFGSYVPPRFARGERNYTRRRLGVRGKTRVDMGTLIWKRFKLSSMEVRVHNGASRAAQGPHLGQSRNLG